MCIVFYTVAQPGYKLILAANRDEFLDRPSSPAQWHNFGREGKNVLCGRDLGSEDKGTWLGMTRDLRVGILTNIRSPPIPPHAPSRGRLLKDYLSGQTPMDTYLAGIDAESYVGFNLLLWDLKSKSAIGYITNRPHAHVEHPRPKHCVGMSNSALGEPYPKVIEGVRAMEATLGEWAQKGEGEEQLVDRMFDLLSPAPPIGGIDDMSRAIRVTPFAVPSENGTRWYGTRLSTVIIVKDDDSVVFVERDIFELQDGRVVPGKKENDRRERFTGA